MTDYLTRPQSDLAEGPLSIAIDGPAAAGKSTTAREVARRLGLLYVDSGAMYRALALALLEREAHPEDPRAVDEVLARIAIDVAEIGGEPRILLDGTDVTDRLRDERVAFIASQIAPLKSVRASLVERQRTLARDRGVVMEGRDIGTVVLPDAAVKIYLTASLAVRAARRRHELEERGAHASLREIEHAIADRDRRDMERAESPLAVSPDAVVIDTTSLSIPDQVERVIAEVRKRETGSKARNMGADPSPSDGPAAATDIRGFYRVTRTLARAIALSFLRLQVEGLDHLPARGGFILAANHASFIDPPLLGLCATRKLSYLAKEELFRIPLFKHLITALGAFPIHRRGLDRRALGDAKRVLAKGFGLLLFPEGTRTKSGSLGSPRPGVSMLAAEAGVSVVPAHVRGTWRIGRALFRRPPVEVRFGAPIAPPPRGSGPAWREDIREHAECIMRAIASLGEPRSNREAGIESRGSAIFQSQGGQSFHAG